MKVPDNLSYSSVSTLSECGTRWMLEKGYGLRTNTWYTTIMGKAIHTVTEQLDKLALGLDVDTPDFMSEFRKELGKELDRGVEVRPSQKRGLESLGWTGGPNGKDEEWVKLHGPQILQAYLDWRERSGWQILTMPDGEPAIEVPFEIEYEGTKTVGYIDRVMYDPLNDWVIVVDLKAGQKPHGNLQLGDYRSALLGQCGVKADFGCYWYSYWDKGKAAKVEKVKKRVPLLDEDGAPVLYKNGNPKMRTVTEEVELEPAVEGSVKGTTTQLVDLAIYSAEWVEERYAMGRRAIENRIFLPNVSRMCSSCGVKRY